MANGKKFSTDFQQAQEIENTTQILIQSEGWPVQKATLEQIGRALINGNIVPSITGNYPKMSVGFTENVVGDGSTTAEVFSFRPTAGVNRNTLNDGAARIHTLKGNSVVVNQQNKGVNTRTQYGYQTSSNGTEITITNVSAATPDYGNMTDFVDFTIKSGHRYLAITDSTLDLYVNSLIGFSFRVNAISDIAPDLNYDAVWLRTESNIPLAVGESESFYFKIIDLTQEFGAGNEPTTVAEFYQRMPLGVDLDVYNEGTIVNGHYGAIKTTGFNQWDEQWELGFFDTSTGKQGISFENIRNVNPIRVLPNTTYYEKQPNATNLLMRVLEYTQDGTYIGFQYVYNQTFITSPNTAYVNFYMSNVYGSVYNNDICISLYWPTEYGDLYGTYQPYKPFERDLSWVAKYFPNGMRSAGNVADEIRFNSTEQRWEAVRKIGVLDLGTLGWNMQSDTGIFLTEPIANMQTTQGYTQRVDGCCSIYPASGVTSINATMWDKSFLREGSRIYIKDSAYNDTITFREVMAGVLFNYPLAESIVTPITENINFDYDVSDYGTEELIVAEGVESAPLSASIEYSPNVLAILKNAPGIANDVDMLKSQLAALTAQLAALTLNNN